MGSYSEEWSDWFQIHGHILQLEQKGVVTRTFRRLDPERQQAILQAILDEAAEKGPAALNIKEVARRAGVAVGSLYTYFPNREGMLTFAVELSVRLVSDGFAALRPYLVTMPLRETLQMYLAGGVEWSQAYLGMLGLFARAAYHGEGNLAETFVRPIATLLRTMVEEMLAAAAQRGEIRADVDLAATGRVIHALTIALGDSQLLPYLNTYFQVTDEDMSLERVVEAMTSLVCGGVCLPPAGQEAASPLRTGGEGEHE